MMRIGFCSYCQRNYRNHGLNEFIGRLEPGEEIRLYSVCGLCYKNLNNTIVQKVFNEDKEYRILKIQNNILKTEKEKLTDTILLQQKKLIAWGKNRDELNKKL